MGEWAPEIHLRGNHPVGPGGAVLNYPGNPSPLPCFSSRGARDARGEKAREAAVPPRGHPGPGGGVGTAGGGAGEADEVGVQ